MQLHHSELFRHDAFRHRHIGPRDADIDAMLSTIGVESIDELLRETLPEEITLTSPLPLGDALTEEATFAKASELASRNETYTNFVGLGFVGTTTPPVILRNVLENPAWYTSYTPYQAEISQGRLEATLNFQTAVANLTGLDIANASLLDEPTAAAEAMMLAKRATRTTSRRFFVSADMFPHTLAVLRTRAEPVGIELVIDATDRIEHHAPNVFGALFSSPSGTGLITDLSDAVDAVHRHGGLVAVAADLGACVLFRSPGSFGADIAIGSAQRFGVPLGFGGPHAGFIAVRSGLSRHLPGRLVGVSNDRSGAPALRLALQTREQHIRRDKATSNICTAQALLANVAGMYCCWHGPDGLRRISRRIHAQAATFASLLVDHGHRVRHQTFFDTVVVDDVDADQMCAVGLRHRINMRRIDSRSVGVTFDETTDADAFERLAVVWTGTGHAPPNSGALESPVPDELWRTDPLLPHDVFTRYRSEHEMLRYLRGLADRDLALDRTMIPLGSCTMKLNATTEMLPISLPGFADVHPFAPAEHTTGYRQLIDELEAMLAQITGFDAVSVQPNAGSQGELAGLLAIRAYHHSQGQPQRNVCLIPASAHGTNAASAVMAGYSVSVVACDERGNVDVADLDVQLDEAGDRLGAIMITYPSTHGVYEPGIVELCNKVHAHGGQVYIDGANMNALVGLARPGDFGADVSHINLHKTFCIPHGGGGPGVGPIGVKQHLAKFLPADPAGRATPGRTGGPVSGTNYGSAGILPIAWSYLKLMGADGLRQATTTALCAANYLAVRLQPAYPVLYTGPNGRVAHECIIDVREITKNSGVTVDDIAKRLIDYGFHAPTVSFPVAGTLMIEPTESESVAELDRFVDAMLQIRAEIEQVLNAEIPIDESPLRRAPHTIADLVETWDRPYPRSVAAPSTTHNKYFPPVGRIDNAFGDRNLVCDCAPLEAYAAGQRTARDLGNAASTSSV